MALAGFEPTTADLPGVRDAGQPAGEGSGSEDDALPAPSLDTGPNNSARCTRVRVLSTETGEVRGLPCRSWRCDRCAVSNRRAFSKRLRLGLNTPGEQLPKLLTLTSQPDEDPARSRRALSRRFEDLRRRLARSFPLAHLEYAGTVELTRRGAVHFHVVLRGVPYMPQPVWSRLAARSGFGPIVDIRRVRTGDLSRYMAKDLGRYLTKGTARGWPPHFRRVRFSRAWAPEWVPTARRAATEAPKRARWTFLRVSQYQLDEEDAGAGQGPPSAGGAAADP